MSEYLINSSTLTGIASAIRSKTGSTSAFTPAQMISEIENISPKKSAIMPSTYYRSTITTFTGDEEYILDDAFYSCRGLSLVSFSNCIAIENNAFMACTSLNSVYFPNCQYIGWSAFQSCFYISSAIISFPNCSFIDGRAFSNCRRLAAAYFPKCASISMGAFYSCRALISLYLNEVESVPSLNMNAFTSTPLSAGGTGKIYVPSSLYSAFLTADPWSTISARLVSM